MSEIAEITRYTLAEPEGANERHNFHTMLAYPFIVVKEGKVIAGTFLACNAERVVARRGGEVIVN